MLWEINKIDKALDHDYEQWTKEEKVRNVNIRNDRYEITTDSRDIKSILKQHYEQNYANKLENLKETSFILMNKRGNDDDKSQTFAASRNDLSGKDRISQGGESLEIY